MLEAYFLKFLYTLAKYFFLNTAYSFSKAIKTIKKQFFNWQIILKTLKPYRFILTVSLNSFSKAINLQKTILLFTLSFYG